MNQESGITNQEINTLPQEKTKNFSKVFFILVFVLLLLLLLLANETYRPHTSFGGTKEVEIAPGLGSRKIGALLKEEGVIRSKWAFINYVSLRKEASYLKPGTYIFEETMTIPEIARTLVGTARKEKAITISEGWRIEEIEKYLTAEDIITDEYFTTLAAPEGGSKFVSRFSFLGDKPESAGLEGYLFPDTYRIYTGEKLEVIAEKMLENFNHKLTPELREEISRQKKTIFEIITIASLIEKEVVSDEDRALVSGILWKRLGIDMPLQVDATISYIKNQKESNGKILTADTKIDSPYNTYLYHELPKGPIGNPGMSAIRAAIYPKESPYLYYLSTPEGETIFSQTLEEHNIAKARYLK